jgi:hypothetical protein
MDIGSILKYHEAANLVSLAKGDENTNSCGIPKSDRFEV